MTNRILAAVLVPLAAAGLIFGCQSIAGIKDHDFSANQQCEQYCDLVQSACGSGTYSTLYPDRQSCLSVCGMLDPSTELTGNTLGCRESILNSGERSECANAGLGGGGSCGSKCESYCANYAQVCASQFAIDFGTGADSQSICQSKCQTLPDNQGFDITSDSVGNTLQCRLAHLTMAAAAANPAAECASAEIRASEQCAEDPNGPGFCDNFCTFDISTCTGDKKVYETPAQCLAVCNVLPPGEKTDSTLNTRACRMYHVFNALLIGGAHCGHTGPGGDGHCGPTNPDAGTGNCESYCMLLEKACNDKFQSTYTSSDKQTECESACNALPGAAKDTGYSVDSPDAGANGTVQCRLLHLARELEHPGMDPNDCESAIGNGDCR